MKVSLTTQKTFHKIHEHQKWKRYIQRKIRSLKYKMTSVIPTKHLNLLYIKTRPSLNYRSSLFLSTSVFYNVLLLMNQAAYLINVLCFYLLVTKEFIFGKSTFLFRSEALCSIKLHISNYFINEVDINLVELVAT